MFNQLTCFSLIKREICYKLRVFLTDDEHVAYYLNTLMIISAFFPMFSIHQRLIVYVFPALSGAFKLFNDYYEFLKVSFVAMLKIFIGVTKHNSLFMRYSKNKQVIGNIWI